MKKTGRNELCQPLSIFTFYDDCISINVSIRACLYCEGHSLATIATEFTRTLYLAQGHLE